MEDFIQQCLDSPNAEEAREWLNGASEENFRNLGELSSTEESLQLVDEIYAAGAVKVFAVDIDREEEDENSGKLVIELSDDQAEREATLAIAGKLAIVQGFEAEPDTGQRHVFVTLD
ncbi:MAG: hypothetical protein NXI22_24265 [bacterium]|nr:hypothetical protein [bacterium]